MLRNISKKFELNPPSSLLAISSWICDWRTEWGNRLNVGASAWRLLTSTKYFRASAGVSRLTQVFWQTDRRTTEEHANIGILRSSSWKFEVNPSSNLGGDVRSSFLTDRHTDRRTTEYHANIGILRSSSWKFEVNPSSSLVGFVQSSFWPRPTGHVLLIVYGQN